MKALQRQDRAQFFGKLGNRKMPKDGVHKHLFVSGIDGVITGKMDHFWCYMCRKARGQGDEGVGHFLVEPIVWENFRVVYQDLEGNYERKLVTGSFHDPIERDWEKGVYLDPLAVHGKKGSFCV